MTKLSRSFGWYIVIIVTKNSWKCHLMQILIKRSCIWKLIQFACGEWEQLFFLCCYYHNIYHLNLWILMISYSWGLNFHVSLGILNERKIIELQFLYIDVLNSFLYHIMQLVNKNRFEKKNCEKYDHGPHR